MQAPKVALKIACGAGRLRIEVLGRIGRWTFRNHAASNLSNGLDQAVGRISPA